jgi:hypothetical protein
VSVPTDGSIWVDVDTGTVVRTHIHMTLVVAPPPDDPHTGSVEIDVTYRRVAALDMWLPDAMTESYESVGSHSSSRSMPFNMTGEAKYTNYRQFQTTIRIK